MFAPAAHGYGGDRQVRRQKGRGLRLRGNRPVISREQIVREKARVYAPTKRKEGIEWKELHAGMARMMQYFCSEYKTEKLLNMGLDALNEIEEDFVPKLYALDPHKLLRSLEDLNILTFSQLIIRGSLARKASSRPLNFQRIDYPQMDPPEWKKFITLAGERQGGSGDCRTAIGAISGKLRSPQQGLQGSLRRINYNRTGAPARSASSLSGRRPALVPTVPGTALPCYSAPRHSICPAINTDAPTMVFVAPIFAKRTRGIMTPDSRSPGACDQRPANSRYRAE